MVVLHTKHMGWRVMFWGEEAAGKALRQECTWSAERMVRGFTCLEQGSRVQGGGLADPMVRALDCLLIMIHFE